MEAEANLSHMASLRNNGSKNSNQTAQCIEGRNWILHVAAHAKCVQHSPLSLTTFHPRFTQSNLKESEGCLVVPAVFKTVGRRLSRLRCVRFAPSPPLLENDVFTLFAAIYASVFRSFCENNNFPSFVTDYLFLVK